MNIYIGNLSYQTINQDLEELFSTYGEVIRAHVVTDRETGRSRGFGFIEMVSKEAGEQAIAALHDQPFMDRNLNINEALPREQKPRRY